MGVLEKMKNRVLNKAYGKRKNNKGSVVTKGLSAIGGVIVSTISSIIVMIGSIVIIIVIIFSGLIGAIAGGNGDGEKATNVVGLAGGFIAPSEEAYIGLTPGAYGWFIPSGHTGLDFVVHPTNPKPAVAVYDGYIVQTIGGCPNSPGPTDANGNVLDWDKTCPSGGWSASAAPNGDYTTPSILIGGGNRVILKINHPSFPDNDLYVVYNHMQSVKSDLVNQYVEKGTIIGVPGDTGHSFGNHFHICVAKLPKGSSYTQIGRENLIDPLAIFCGIRGSEGQCQVTV